MNHSAGIRATVRAPFSPTVVGLLAASLPGFAQAEDATQLPDVNVSASAEPTYLREETGLTRLPGSLRDQPQSISVVSQQLMEDQGAVTLRQALRNVAGISFTAGEGGFSGDNINLRGFSARNDLFLDGVRDNGQYTRDTFNIEAVEVLKGPSSMVFGRGTTGGAINQQSKRPQLDDFRSIGATIGTNNDRRMTLDVNQPLDDTSAARLNAMWHDADFTREDVEFKRYGIAPSFTFGIGTDTEVNFSYFRQKEDNVPFYGVPYRFGKPVSVDKDNFYGLADEDFEKTTTDIASITFEHRFNDRLSLTNHTRYSHYDREISPSAPRIANNPPAGTPYDRISVNRSKPYRDGTDTVLANQTDLTARFDTGDIKHTLVSGIEISRETSKVTRYSVSGAPQTNLENPDPDQAAPNLRVLGRSSYTDASANTFSLYTLDEMQVAPNWKVVAGLRWDRFSAHSLADSYNATTGVLTSSSDKDRVDKMTSGRFGIIYQPDAVQSYYIGIGSSFNPSAETLTISDANNGLDPEKNINYELGAKWDLNDGKLGLRAAIFRTDKTNARTVDPDQLNVNVLDGRWVTDGVEFEVTGRLAPGWEIAASAAFMDPEITESNNPAEKGKVPANAPKHTYSLWTTYQLGGGWEIGGGVQGVGKRYGNNTNTVAAPGYHIWDAEFAYKQADYDIRINVYNLTDQLYYESVYGGHAVPGIGRTALLSVDYRF